MTSSAQLSTQLFCAFTKQTKKKTEKKKEKKRKRERKRKRKSEGLKAVKHRKHGFKTPANHHTEYLALILVIKYISHYNHLS